VTVEGTISNTGSGPAGPFYWSIKVDGTAVAVDQVGSGLAAGASVPVSAANLGPYSPGTHTVELCVDIDTDVPESDETNNCASRSFTVGSSWINVTINTSPVGFQVAVDGSTYTAPFAATWLSSSTHTIGAPSPQGGGFQVRSYAYTSWSDSGAQTHTVAPTTSSTFTATFNCREQEGNNNSSASTWELLGLNETCFGYIGTQGDVDWWRITMSSSGTIRVVLAVPADKDYDLEIYSGQTGSFVCGSYRGTGQGESVACTAEEGTYFARVYGFAGDFSSGQLYGINWY
jgi:hypothetical protein